MVVSGQHHAPVALSPVKNLGTHLIAGWVGPKADLDILEKKKYLASVGTRTRAIHPLA
jgi:hypothetical protein